MPFHPKDVFHLTVVRGDHLMASDVGGTSDPFVEVSIVGRDGKVVAFSGKTAIVMKNVNPVWNSEFESNLAKIDDYGKGIKIKFTVLDFDKFTKNDDIGKVSLKLKAEELKPSREYEKSIKLKEATSGTITIKYRYESYLAKAISNEDEYRVDYPFGDNSVEFFIQNEYKIGNLNFDVTEKSVLYRTEEKDKWVLAWFANFGELCPEMEFDEIVENVKSESIAKLMKTYLKAKDVIVNSDLPQYAPFGHSKNKLIIKTYKCSMEYTIGDKKDQGEIRLAQQSNGLWGIYLGYGHDLDMIFQNTIINM